MNTSGYGRVVCGALLAKALKRLRRDSGRQQKQVANALGWSVSKIILIEDGGVRISAADLQALLDFYAVSDQAQLDELHAWNRGVGETCWWDGFRIEDKAFQLYVGYESGATSIRMAQELLVPGLLQTEDYARLMTRTHVTPDEVDSVVQVRLRRQREVFAREPEQYHILDEAVLRRRVGEVMPAQLRYLAELARRSEITIRVIPFEAGPHFGLKGSFVLLGFDDVPLDNVLYLESARRGNLLAAERQIVASGPGALDGDNAAEEIARHEDGFEMLSGMALGPDESIGLIERIAREMH